jgi:hypothetical protein
VGLEEWKHIGVHLRLCLNKIWYHVCGFLNLVVALWWLWVMSGVYGTWSLQYLGWKEALINKNGI